jgi:dynein heavy chain
MQYLYGYTNTITNEWTDGIFAKTIFEMDLKEKLIIVCDGPVDSLWVENLNSVLDDSKMLCLSNGQRIKLP